MRGHRYRFFPGNGIITSPNPWLDDLIGETDSRSKLKDGSVECQGTLPSP